MINAGQNGRAGQNISPEDAAYKEHIEALVAKTLAHAERSGFIDPIPERAMR